MSKVKSKSAETARNAESSKTTNSHKRTKPMKKKKKSKDANKSNAFLPPTNAEDFSANWKALLEVLNSEKAKLDDKKDTNIKMGESHKKIGCKDVKPAKAGKTALVKLERTGTSSGHSDACLENGGESSGPKLKTQKRKGNAQQGQGKKTNKKMKVESQAKETPEMDIWFDDVDPDDIEAAVGPEAAEVMRRKLGLHRGDPETTEKALVKDRAYEGLTRAVAMDCEMVGVGPEGVDSILARVSLVNQFGKCIYDKYVKPTERVTDYRTAVSGIRPQDIVNGEEVKKVQKEVAEILKGRILVGHAIHNDLKILLLDHPKKKIRDTQKYKPFQTTARAGRPSLRVLCKEILSVKVQQGEHSSVQDAQATMRLYTLVKKQWEAELKAKRELKTPGKPRSRAKKN